MKNIHIAARLVFGAIAVTATPALAQDSRTSELYHIFDFKTDSRRGDMIKALQDGLNPNISNANTVTPIVMGPPPEKPGRFTLVNPLEDSRLGGLAAMMGSAQAVMFKQVKCDGAVWISSASRRVRGSQSLHLTFCLFPYAGGYQLDVYGLDMKERGGGLSERLGRALGEAMVGKPEQWTAKTIVDAVRHTRTTTQATVTYIEGQPEFVGSPWNDDGRRVLPSSKEQTRDPN